MKTKKVISGIAFIYVFAVVFISLLLSFSGCTERNYGFTKYAVKTGFDIAQDAGAFDERTIEFKKVFAGDTLFFYEGINKYYIAKTDSSFIVVFTPSRKNLEDTTLSFLRKKLVTKTEK